MNVEVLSDEGKEIELKETEEGALKSAADLGIEFRRESQEELEEAEEIQGIEVETDV